MSGLFKHVRAWGGLFKHVRARFFDIWVACIGNWQIIIWIKVEDCGKCKLPIIKRRFTPPRDSQKPKTPWHFLWETTYHKKSSYALHLISHHKIIPEYCTLIIFLIEGSGAEPPGKFSLFWGPKFNFYIPKNVGQFTTIRKKISILYVSKIHIVQENVDRMDSNLI